MTDVTNLTEYPIGTSALAPLSRNAGDLDKLVNGTGTVENRAGGILTTWQKLEADFGADATAVLSNYAAFNNTGDWVTGTAYQVNDLWSDSGNWYLVLEAYTSGATAADDIAGGTVALYQSPGTVWQVGSIAEIEVLAALEEGQALYLSAGGCSGTFIWDGSDLSTEVAADTLQGVYIAPSSDATGASGAWVRNFSGGVDPKWFGDSLSAVVSLCSVTGGYIEHSFPIYDYSGESTIVVPSSGIEVDFGLAQISGPGGSTPLFNISAASGGSVSVRGGVFSSVFRLFSVDDAASVDFLEISGVKTSGELLTYFNSGSPAYIARINIDNNEITASTREGFHYRGWWDYAKVSGNTMISGVEHYAIRLGFDESAADWHRMGYASISGNTISEMYNPVSGGGSNECNAIAVFSERADVTGNSIYDINGAGVDDIEGIYTKVRFGTVSGNNLKDACRREGQITLKRPQPSPAGTYADSEAIQVFGNVCSFSDSRSHEASISIQVDNCSVYGNYCETGDGIASESAGIVIKYRSAYSNISIRGNNVYMKSGTAGILAWCYGSDISITENKLWGDDASYGINLETRDSGDTRYPDSDSPIGEKIIVRDNTINSGSTVTRGLRLQFNGTDAPVSSLKLVRNSVLGNYSEYVLSIATGSTGSGWDISGNDFSGVGGVSSFQFSSFPTSFTVSGNVGLTTAARGSDSLAGSAATKTFSTGINADLASYLEIGDVQISPQSIRYFERQVYIDTVFASGSIRVAGDSGNPNASEFSWSVSLEGRTLS